MKSEPANTFNITNNLITAKKLTKNVEILHNEAQVLIKEVNNNFENYKQNRIEFLKYQNEYKYRLLQSCLEIGKILIPLFVAGLSIQQLGSYINTKVLIISIFTIITILFLIGILIVNSINKSNSEYSNFIETTHDINTNLAKLEKVSDIISKSKNMLKKSSDLINESKKLSSERSTS